MKRSIVIVIRQVYHFGRGTVTMLHQRYGM